jgi:hypothetical protein
VRINIYEEELTDEVRVVSTVAENTGITYYGTRFYLKSAPELHDTVDDDDRSAVTFWFGRRELCEAFANRCARLLRDPLDDLYPGSTKETRKETLNG